MSHPVRVRVKICGITRPGDALVAACAGADAIGLVFHPASPRAVSIAQAKDILAVLPPFVTTVGLFVNAEPDAVQAVLDQLPLDLLQFHGDETPQYCAAFARPYIKAIRVRADTDIAQVIAQFSTAQGILLDAWHKDVYGGSGQAFDWSLLAPVKNATRIILAGGLKAANVATAINTVEPWAVDVSSGVESEPGIKSEQSIRDFMQEVQRV